MSSSALTTMTSSPVAMTVSIGGFSFGRAAGGPQPDERRILEREQRVAEGAAGELGQGREVDLVAIEVEELRVDHRQAGLPTRLGGDAGDEVAGQDELGLAAADQPGDVDVARVVELGHDVVRLGPATRVVGDREHRLDDVRVGVVGLGRQDDDRARGLEPGDLEIVDVHRDAGPADDRGPPGVRQAGPDVVVHVALVSVREDDDRTPGLVDVGRDELRDDGVDLLRPAEDDRVAGLDDTRAALAQRGELALEAGVDDADEGADDEDPEQGDGQHPEQEPERALVAAHGPRVEGPHEAVPQQVRERRVATEEDRDHDRHEDDADRGDHEQAEDQRDRAARHEVVECVAEPFGAGGLLHADLDDRGSGPTPGA